MVRPRLTPPLRVVVLPLLIGAAAILPSTAKAASVTGILATPGIGATTFPAPSLDACYNEARTFASAGISVTVTCMQPDGSVTGLSCAVAEPEGARSPVVECQPVSPQKAMSLK